MTLNIRYFKSFFEGMRSRYSQQVCQCLRTNKLQAGKVSAKSFRVAGDKRQVLDGGMCPDEEIRHG
jgi:hypothetical protein